MFNINNIIAQFPARSILQLKLIFRRNCVYFAQFSSGIACLALLLMLGTAFFVQQAVSETVGKIYGKSDYQPDNKPQPG